MPQQIQAQQIPQRESIAQRHARLFDRREKHSIRDDISRYAASVVIIGALLGSLWFFGT